MTIPAQEVQVVSTNRERVSDAEYEALRHPSEDSLREELSRVPEQLDQLFEALPKSDAEVDDVNNIVNEDRTDSGQVRKAVLELRDGTKIQAQTIHFRSSPEVWVVKALETVPGAPKYLVHSWYGIRQPCVQLLSAEGELIAGTQTNYSHPAQDLLSNVFTCEDALEDIQVKKKITGTPRFRDDAVLAYLEQHRGELDVNVSPAIEKLPQKVIEAAIRGDVHVGLGGIAPNNRKDLTFHIDGELQLDAVREACSELMQIHDILKQHGFSPILKAEFMDGIDIPFLTLYLETEDALKNVDMGPVVADTTEQ